jgi:hypothetical protein
MQDDKFMDQQSEERFGKLEHMFWTFFTQFQEEKEAN